MATGSDLPGASVATGQRGVENSFAIATARQWRRQMPTVAAAALPTNGGRAGAASRASMIERAMASHVAAPTKVNAGRVTPPAFAAQVLVEF
jgi:hypothetical protein